MSLTHIKGEIAVPYEWSYGPVLGQFFAGMKDGKLLGARCAKCKRVMIPPLPVCGPCFLPVENVLVEVGPEAVVQTYTIINITYPGQLMSPPYAVGILRLTGSHTRMQHLVGGSGIAGLRIGSRVRPVWKPPEERTGSFFDIRWFEPVEETQ